MEEPHSAFCLQTLDHQDPSVRIDGINRKLCLVYKLSSYMGGAVANSQMTFGAAQSTREGPVDWIHGLENLLCVSVPDQKPKGREGQYRFCVKIDMPPLPFSLFLGSFCY